MSIIRDVAISFVNVFAGLAAALTIILAVTAWQLSKGPISLSFLTPYIENVVNINHLEFKLKMGDTILTWAGWERNLDVRILDVTLLGQNDNVIGNFPEVSFTLSGRALFSGQFAPKKIELFGPSLQVRRIADGSFSVGFQGEGNTKDNLGVKMLALMSQPPDPENPMSFLTSINVVGAEVSVTDEVMDQTWNSPSSDISISRSESGLVGIASLITDVDGRQTEVELEGKYRRADTHMEILMNFTDISATAMASITPALADSIHALEFPVQGQVTLGLFINGHIDVVDFNLLGGKGRIVIPGDDKAISVLNMAVSGNYDEGLGRVEIKDLYVELEENTKIQLVHPLKHEIPLQSLSLSARYLIAEQKILISGMKLNLNEVSARSDIALAGFKSIPDLLSGNDDFNILFKGELGKIPVNQIDDYWPEQLGVDVRGWVLPHFSNGIVESSSIDFELTSSRDGKIKLSSLNGKMKVRGTTLDFLPPMPAATDVDANVTFNTKQFDINILKGKSSGLELTKGRVLLTGADQIDQHANIELSIKGSVPETLKYMNNKPLEYISKLGIDMSSATGQAETELKLGFLIEHALSLEKIDVSASSKVTDFSLDNALFGKSVENGDLALMVDKAGLDAVGEIVLGRIPAHIKWRENFTEDRLFKGQYDISAWLEDIRHIEDLGADIQLLSEDYIKGALNFDARYIIFDEVDSRLEVSADITNSIVQFEPAGWAKPAQIPGTAKININFKHDRIFDIPDFSLDANELKVAGSVKFMGNGEGSSEQNLERIDFSRLSFGRTDMVGALIPKPGEGWDVGFSGSSLDLSGFREYMKPQPEDSEKEDNILPPLSLALELDRVWIDQGRSVSNVSGTFAYDSELWQTVLMTGTSESGSKLSFHIKPVENDKRELRVESDNAGETLRLLDLYENMRGGNLQIAGTYDDTIKGSPLGGRVLIRDYRIADAPILANVLSVMALTGIVDVLSGDGLGFDALDIPYVYHDGTIKITDARAVGASLGFTGSGTIYSDAEILELNGTIIPIYALNSFLGNIPILGDILTGGEKGGGIFAARYAIRGPSEAPTVSVNPLSVLTPGFLRNLFGIVDGNVSPDDTKNKPERTGKD